MEKVDARGLSCPQPVVLTLKAINQKLNQFEVLVDSTVSKENVLRCLKNNGMSAEIKEAGEEFFIIAKKN